MRTSTAVRDMNADIIKSRLRSSHFSAACFPLSASRDPERQQNQPDVEPESGALHVEAIESELVRPRDVARRVHLHQPRQNGPHYESRLVARDLLERDQLPIDADLDFDR